MKTDIWRQQTRDRDRETSDREEKRRRGNREGARRRREGDVSVCRKKEVSEDTGDSF